jgi:iron complex outermembrane receptor protein
MKSSSGARVRARNRPVFAFSRLRLALCAALAHAPSGYAAEDASAQQTAVQPPAAAQQLDEIAIRADKPAVPANVPNTVESVTAKKIAENVNSVTTAGVLQYLPSAHVRERYVGDVNGVLVLRVNSSIASAQTTVYANGLLLSNFLNNSFSTAPRWGLVSPDEIERVDVMYGPFSALYPGNSAGGVVNITTRMPTRLEGHVRADYFTQHFKEYGTNDDFSGWHTSASVGDKIGDWSFWIDADHLDNHGQPQTFGAATAKSGLPANPGTFTSVSGAQFDTDTAGKPRVTTSSASADHNVQDNGKIKLAYDFSPTVRATYTLGIWNNTSNKLGDSYLRDAAGNTIYGTKSGLSPYQFVRINGQDYSVTAPTASRQEATSYLHGFDLKTNSGGMWDWEAIASLYDASKDATRTSATSGSYGTIAATAATAGTYTDASGTGWWNLDLRGDWRPGGNRQSPHQLSFGAHLDRYTLESDTFNLVSGTNFYSSDIGALSSNARGKTQTAAAYLQDAWAFAPTWKLVVGARAERWRAFDGSNFAASKNVSYADRSVDQVSPKAALTWQVSDDWLVRASIGKAARFPTVGELFANQTVKDSGGNTLSSSASPVVQGFINQNNPTLKPERVVSSELAIERALGNGIVRVSLFHEDKSDALIAQTDTTTLPALGFANFTISSVQNVDRLRTDGVEVAFTMNDVLLNGLDFEGSATYTDSIIVSDRGNPGLDGTDQPRIPHKRATLVATYHVNPRLTLSLAGRYSGHQHNALYDTVNHRYVDVNPDVYGAVSQYTVVDAKALYRFSTHWSASVGVNNIGNYQYFVNPNPYPQRTYYAGLKLDF